MIFSILFNPQMSKKILLKYSGISSLSRKQKAGFIWTVSNFDQKTKEKKTLTIARKNLPTENKASF